MPWIQAHLTVSQDLVDRAELVLLELGAVSVTFGDAKDEPVLETLPDEIRLWSLIRVTGLFEFSDTAMDQVRQGINQAFQADISRQLELEILQDQAWERAWLDHFKPMRFGEQLWICPTGLETGQETGLAVDATNATIIELDPGLAFGTGTHPTTALCLQWLDQHREQLAGQQLIDYGCGSGILGIAALKLGAGQVTGIDHDPQALQASRDNAANNGVSERLALCMDPAELPDQVDMLLANILAGVLVELAPQLTEQVKPRGQIVLSGILSDQAEAVLDAYQSAFDMEPIAEQEGWVRLAGRRRT